MRSLLMATVLLAAMGSIGKGKVSAVPEWLDWDLWQTTAPRTEFRDNVVHYNWHWFRRWGTSEMGNNAPKGWSREYAKGWGVV